MSKKLVIVSLLLMLLLTTSVIAAQIYPNYVPVEVELLDKHSYVFPDLTRVSFEGKWAGGQTSIYHVVMDYGDKNTEEYDTTKKVDYFYHRYNLTGRPSGYKWNVRLTVSNGNTAYDTAVVEVY